jgi:hypothetical protein
MVRMTNAVVAKVRSRYLLGCKLNKPTSSVTTCCVSLVMLTQMIQVISLVYLYIALIDTVGANS